MKKFLFVMIMFFGLVGSTLSDDLTSKVAISSFAAKFQIGDYFNSPVSTPAVLLLLGFGLIGLAKFVRKKT